MMSLGEELGGPSKAQAMIKAQGISLILKSIDVQFRRPVTYPDTVRTLLSLFVFTSDLLRSCWLAIGLFFLTRRPKTRQRFE